MRILTKIFGNKKVVNSEDSLKELSDEEFESAKFKARIALIDDEELPHVSRLQKDGYSITHYHDIENIDDLVRKKYHLIVLDIQGVGAKLSNEEGWGVLRYLKNEYPHILIIVFTGADWSITKYKDKADLADIFIGKDVDFLDFKSKIDAGIRKVFSPNFHFEITKNRLLKSVSGADSMEKIKKLVFAYGANKTKAMDEIKKVPNIKDSIGVVDDFLSIIETTIGLLK